MTPNNQNRNRSTVEVFVTKTNKFRAKIKESKTDIPYEVTIGGKSWNNGVGKKYEKIIRKKMQRIKIALSWEYKKKYWYMKKLFTFLAAFSLAIGIILSISGDRSWVALSALGFFYGLFMISAIYLVKFLEAEKKKNKPQPINPVFQQETVDIQIIKAATQFRNTVTEDWVLSNDLARKLMNHLIKSQLIEITTSNIPGTDTIQIEYVLKVIPPKKASYKRCTWCDSKNDIKATKCFDCGTMFRDMPTNHYK